jgi:hypothetical protein
MPFMDSMEIRRMNRHARSHPIRAVRIVSASFILLKQAEI